jgi:uncharacterized circularly permuted ATP-grasp superfamily protein
MLSDSIEISHRLNECINSDGGIAPVYRSLMKSLESFGTDTMRDRWRMAKRESSLDAFTFLLDPKSFRPVPTDWIPRIITSDQWDTIAAGISQRIRALNHFLRDVYCGQQNIVPNDVVYSCQYFYPEFLGLRPAKDVFVHIYGIDLVHLGNGDYYVLEDNLRIPSGITYQMKSVEIARKIMPELANGYDIVPYDIKETYHNLFLSLSEKESPKCVLLTDSKYGAAFFEHRYLAELLQVPLLEGSDLYIGPDGYVYAKAIGGDFMVDIIYRRVEDIEMFVPGLTDAYLQKKVVLINAMGTGAGDDKLVFLWVPEMIKQYLGEEPILSQAVSYDLRTPEARQYVLQNLDSLVLKTRQGYGGLGVFIMPDQGDIYRTRLTQQLLEQPQAFIAQETLDFSNHLIFDETDSSFGERYIDLRVFAVQNGDGEVTVFPGGLTRVSGSQTRITNNSSGGLCKPTWVVR